VAAPLKPASETNEAGGGPRLEVVAPLLTSGRDSNPRPPVSQDGRSIHLSYQRPVEHDHTGTERLRGVLLDTLASALQGQALLPGLLTLLDTRSGGPSFSPVLALHQASRLGTDRQLRIGDAVLLAVLLD
jgi:hypothetical protein